MRLRLPLLALVLGLSASARAQSCTGLCLQQVSCAPGTRSTVTGTVFAPNGVDPIPNVTVYIPNAPVPALPAGVQCPAPGAVPPGSPLLGALTAYDGTFTLLDVPIGTNIPIVIVSGKWRRQITIDTSQGSCTNTAADPTLTRFPRNQSEGDIPKIAIATGNADPVECVLRKMQIDASEFTNPGGGGRINFYLGEGGATSGSQINAATPSAVSLMGDQTVLNSYDVLMLPCQGADNTATRQSQSTTAANSPQELQHLVAFANVGGRVYSSHWSEDWLNEAQSFRSVANWISSNAVSNSQTAIVDQNFAGGSTLAQWLSLPTVNVATAPGQLTLTSTKANTSGINAPTQSWIHLPATGTPANGIMQFTFDAPLNQTTGQCGRVLYNEYHVEDQVGTTHGATFSDTLCRTSTSMSPQEKLLEYMLFNLTSDGGNPTMTPASADFGSESIGFATSPQYFTWTNNSIFSSGVTLTNTTGDFNVVGNNCSVVAAGASCQIAVNFAPTVLGARTGVLSVGGSGKTLTATLTGIGTPGLTYSATAVNFGNVDVGGSAVSSFNVTNAASGPLPLPALLITGDYTSTNNCGGSIATGATCSVFVKFAPSTTGPRTGTLTLNSTYNSTAISLSGNGVDFTLALSPSSGTAIAGRGTTFTVTATSIAGYNSMANISCSTNTPGTTCLLAAGTINPSSAGTQLVVAITTTAEYGVIGYGNVGGSGWLAVFAGGSLWLLWRKRRSGASLLASGVLILLLGAGMASLTGCSGSTPDQRKVYTAPGTYNFTITATDGTITHSANYALNVTEN